ncbi:MAG TPA: lytic transglycosylase domain-containing protein [Longimicrobiales bacterium]|nr:lytic transglycosylase domain-containing protein [Longimicrobiales bacterium]
MAAPNERHHRRQDDPQDTTGNERPHGRREEDSAVGAASRTSESGSRGQEFFRRFRQPLIGLGLAGMALPMVQATTKKPSEPAPDTDAADPRTASAAGGDVEENLVNRIAETKEEAARTKQVEAAMAKYDISRDMAEDIYDIAREQDIDPKLAFGLVKTESTFDEHAVSHVGARGLTQVMPRTAAWLIPGTTTEDLYDRQTNLRLGFQYLDQMIEKYKGDVRLALLAYNRGPGTVDRVLDRGGNPDNGYADKVLSG